MAVKKYSLENIDIVQVLRETPMGEKATKHHQGKSGVKAFVVTILFLCLICSLLPQLSSAEASTMECAKLGDAMGQVLRYCGEPGWVDRTEESRQCVLYQSVFIDDGRRRWINRPYFAPCIVQIEEWTYNFGPTKFLRILTFEDRILVNVRSGAYGY